MKLINSWKDVERRWESIKPWIAGNTGALLTVQNENCGPATPATPGADTR